MPDRAQLFIRVRCRDYAVRPVPCPAGAPGRSLPRHGGPSTVYTLCIGAQATVATLWGRGMTKTAILPAPGLGVLALERVAFAAASAVGTAFGRPTVARSEPQADVLLTSEQVGQRLNRPALSADCNMTRHWSVLDAG